VYLQRKLNLKDLLNKKSFFLFGPRSTGKSSLIGHQLGEQALIIDLLQGDIYLQLSAKPWELKSIIDAAPKFKYVIIDEIQKVPQLLDEVHSLIEKQGIKFLLTGSSARKLKKTGVNLLAGRAWVAELFPLVMQEIPNFDLNRYLLCGGLPQVYLGEYPDEELRAYVNTYLKEEIQTEALVRKLQSFARFLEVAAITSGKMINFAELSNDVAIPASTVREYYSILEDTLIGFILPAWTKTVKRKAMSTAKFYFFDIGVRNKVAGIKNIEANSVQYGDAFEHFIAMELRAYISYMRLDLKLSYWHSYNNQEVDFIIGDDIAVEVKSTNNPNAKHLKGLKILMEENICKKYFLICMTNMPKKIDNIHILNWQDFLQKLWDGHILSDHI
jgi:predicted AAA+ superfamily ATPase